MRKIFKSAVMAFSLAAGAAFAQGAGYSVQDTEIGTLLDDPAAAAVLDKHMPGFSKKDTISKARAYTLPTLQMFVPSLTDEILSAIDSDLKKLPPKK